PDGAGGWVWNLQGVEPTLYRLPQVIEAVCKGEVVFVVEGERDVHSLESIGLTATTNAMGAGKWRDSYSETLRGAKVAILPDADPAGRKHGEQVARSLHGKASSVKVIELPGLAEKQDVSDWLRAGHTREELLALVADTQEWERMVEQPEADLLQRTDTKIAILSKFYPRPFTDHILQRIPFRWEGERGLLWRFDSGEGLWRPDGESFLSAYFRRDLDVIADDLKKRNVIQEIVADVAGCSYHPGGLPEPPLHLIPFANGVYDLNAGGFRAFEAGDHFTFKLPHRYNPAAKSSLLPEIIGSLLPEAETVTLFELIAYSLWRDYPYQRVFFLLGGGGNGKSLFTQTILSHFLGTENVTQIGLQSLQEERFAAAQLHRKLANVAGESPYCDLKSTETLKALCGWDLLTADRKYLTPVRFKNHAKLCFVCNQLPKTHDTTDAFYRRAFIIEFPNQFSDDPTLPMRITENPEEFEWLAVQAVRTLQDLRARNFIFTRHQGLAEVKGEYERRSNPLVRFIGERCIRDGEGFIPKWQLTEQFQDFLREAGFISWSDTRLGGGMKELGFETSRRSCEDGKDWRCWLGLSWNPPHSPYSPGYSEQSPKDLRNGCEKYGDPGDPGGIEREPCETATPEEPEKPPTEPAFKCAYCGGTEFCFNPSARDNKGARCCKTTGCLQAEAVT
ncbi:MAG: phage/plasmid primase, P4 family, partial [Armatimonadetes bacterium]|nr:phage/plasmid primase, P4 family [Armatimonadota bacterium]